MKTHFFILQIFRSHFGSFFFCIKYIYILYMYIYIYVYLYMYIYIYVCVCLFVCVCVCVCVWVCMCVCSPRIIYMTHTGKSIVVFYQSFVYVGNLILRIWQIFCYILKNCHLMLFLQNHFL